jgi:hypothetical protein
MRKKGKHVKMLENFKTWLKIRCCGSGSRCLFDPCIRDPGFGSGMNISDHIFECLETIFWVKILKFFDADP